MFIRVMLSWEKKTLTKNQQVFTFAQDYLHSPCIGLMVQTKIKLSFYINPVLIKLNKKVRYAYQEWPHPADTA